MELGADLIRVPISGGALRNAYLTLRDHRRQPRNTTRAMSEENVEIVAHMYDAFGRAGPEGMFEFMDPDINYRAIEGAPDDIGVFTGYDAQRRYLGEWAEMFDDLGVQTESLIDAGDRVVVHLHVTARMKGTDAPVEMRLGVVWTLRDGKVVRGREYATYEEAEQVAGLRG